MRPDISVDFLNLSKSLPVSLSESTKTNTVLPKGKANLEINIRRCFSQPSGITGIGKKSSPRLCDYCKTVKPCDSYTMYDTKIKVVSCAACFQNNSNTWESSEEIERPRRSLSKPIFNQS